MIALEHRLVTRLSIKRLIPRSTSWNVGLPLRDYEEATELEDDSNPLPTKQFVPYLEVRVSARKSILSDSLVARVYFYDQYKQLITSIQQPTAADRGKKQLEAWSPVFRSESIFFIVPDQVQQASDWLAVVIFGDVNGVTAQLYPGSDELSEYDYPGKVPSKNMASTTVEHESVRKPIISHAVLTNNKDDPKITFFMRQPLNTIKASEAQGVLCFCLLGGTVNDVVLQLQGVKGRKELGAVLKFADDHKLIVLCWGSHNGGLWDPSRSWYQQTRKDAVKSDKAFDQVAAAWSNGVQYFIKKCGIPKNNYLLWGISGSAQYACRLALRKPEYFLAVHVHIPSSFDKPTPKASKILWCLTTGNLESGYQRSLLFYTQCRTLGYPMIYKAVAGLGHGSSPISDDLGLKFFEYALSVRNQRLTYDASPNNPLTQIQLAQTDGTPIQPWLDSFCKPAYVGDAVNQGMFPYEQQDMVPVGLRVPLPTKEIADAWNH